MGLYDEHWCSKCKKALNKKKDKYVEINMVNADKRKAKKKGLHNRVFLCQDCLKKEENLSEVVDECRKHANPNFKVKIECQAASICPDFTPGNACVNCKNIYCIGDKVYCGRKHPGSVKLNQDAIMVSTEKERAIGEFQQAALHFLPVVVREKLISSLGWDKINAEPQDRTFFPDEEIVVDENLVPEHPLPPEILERLHSVYEEKMKTKK
jgi:hypothetical protein